MSQTAVTVLLFILISVCYGLYNEALHLNLTYGRLRFTENAPDQIIAFKSLSEYHLFLQSNDLQANPNEPAFLVKCIEANKNYESACLDGTPQAFYFRPGYDDGLTKYAVYLKGGGWCGGVDEAVASSCNGCYSRSKGQLGSSKAYEPYMMLPEKGDGYLSSQYADNPLAYNWNYIYVPYCDGASFAGNNATVTKAADGTPLYFRGFRNLKAVFELLWTQYGLDNATDVILTGSSAGGLAAWLHADYIGQHFVAKGANYMAMPDSGFFMDYEGSGEFDTCMKWNYEYQNTSIALKENCMDAMDGYKCMFAQNAALYTESKIFALQSRFDTWQITQELKSTNASLINSYGDNLTTTIYNNLMVRGKYAKNHAVFLDSCQHHTGAWNKIVIDDYTSSRAQVQWWFANMTRSPFWFQNETYPCTACCSP